MIQATNTEQITIAPNAVRYSLTVKRFNGQWSGKLMLQRAQRTEQQDGSTTWLDDPRPDARKLNVDIPETAGEALDGLIEILPTVIARIEPIEVKQVGNVRLSLASYIRDDGRLDVRVIVQAEVNSAWRAKPIPSLNKLLAENQDLIVPVSEKWDALDAAIAAANDQEEWV